MEEALEFECDNLAWLIQQGQAWNLAAVGVLSEVERCCGSVKATLTDGTGSITVMFRRQVIADFGHDLADGTRIYVAGDAAPDGAAMLVAKRVAVA